MRRVVFAIGLVTACGGGTQESTQSADQPQFIMMQDGKPVWPPVGPGCDALVACCKDASPGRPSVNLMCQMSAAKPACDDGRKGVVELLENADAAIPATCR